MKAFVAITTLALAALCSAQIGDGGIGGGLGGRGIGGGIGGGIGDGDGHGWGWSHPHYKFSYGVADKHTGDVKSASETRDGHVTKGHYSLVQPDGVVRTVYYVVDGKSGFQAHVVNKGVAHHHGHRHNEIHHGGLGGLGAGIGGPGGLEGGLGLGGVGSGERGLGGIGIGLGGAGLGGGLRGDRGLGLGGSLRGAGLGERGLGGRGGLGGAGIGGPIGIRG